MEAWIPRNKTHSHKNYISIETYITLSFLNHFCLMLFPPFLLQLTIFATVWKGLQPEGAPCSTAWRTDGKAEAEMAAWEKKKRKKTETHTLRCGTTQHTESQGKQKECVHVGVCPCLCVSLHVCVYVWWVKSLRVLVKAVYVLLCALKGKLGSAGHHTNTHWAATLGGTVLF